MYNLFLRTLFVFNNIDHYGSDLKCYSRNAVDSEYQEAICKDEIGFHAVMGKGHCSLSNLMVQKNADLNFIFRI